MRSVTDPMPKDSLSSDTNGYCRTSSLNMTTIFLKTLVILESTMDLNMRNPGKQGYNRNKTTSSSIADVL